MQGRGRATGIWVACAGALAALAAGCGEKITVPRPEGVPADLALYLPEGHACVTPFGDGLRFAGTLELSGINDRVLTNRVGAIRRGAGRYFGGVETAPPTAIPSPERSGPRMVPLVIVTSFLPATTMPHSSPQPRRPSSGAHRTS